MSTQNLPQNNPNGQYPPQDILLVCATRYLRCVFTRLVIPTGTTGKVRDVSPDGRLYVDFGLPTIHLLSPTDNKIAIVAAREKVTE